MPDIFPPYRHIVVIAPNQRCPAKIERETDFCFHTTHGVFTKISRCKQDDARIRFEGPFTAEGDMECRP